MLAMPRSVDRGMASYGGVPCRVHLSRATTLLASWLSTRTADGGAAKEPSRQGGLRTAGPPLPMASSDRRINILVSDSSINTQI